MLANAHLAAILPGLSISVNTLLSQLEPEPDEYVVDPWVIQRVTLVAEDRGNVLAAAHLVRDGSDPHVGADYQGAAEIRWLLCWPGADAVAAGERLPGACLGQFRRWRARREFANGVLPAPGRVRGARRLATRSSNARRRWIRGRSPGGGAGRRRFQPAPRRSAAPTRPPGRPFGGRRRDPIRRTRR